jgi:hypothetical protein
MYYCYLTLSYCQISSFVIGNTHKVFFNEKYNAMFSPKIGKTKELDEEKYNHSPCMGIQVISC